MVQPGHIRTLLLAVAVATVPAGVLLAQKSLAQSIHKSVPLDSGGSLTIDNPFGKILVTGSDLEGLEIDVIKTVRGPDDAALHQGRDLTGLFVGGDQKNRVLKTLVAEPGGARSWTSSVDYEIRIPRNARTTIINQLSELIRVAGVNGDVTVKNVGGRIQFVNVNGSINVDSINGVISATYATPPRVSSRFFSINGLVEVHVPPNSTFDWVAETLQGDILSTMPIRVSPVAQRSGTIMRARVSEMQTGPPGPTIQATSITGRVYLTRLNEPDSSARSLLAPRAPLAQVSDDIREVIQSLVGSVLLEAPTATRFAVQKNLFDGDYSFKTDLGGNVFVGMIRGDAKISTSAGEITLGTVGGTCEAISLGGPLDLGDMHGTLTARTRAGNVTVRAARKGGVLWTDGGNVQLVSNGAPVTLHSGGGNVTLRQAGADVHADAHSGDISIAFDEAIKSAKVDARADGGNVTVRFPPHFGAEIDATVMTSSDDSNRIVTDFPGLAIVKEHLGNRTRIHATGRINGGGQRIELHAENGDIQIRQATEPAAAAGLR